jgi:hypothetical protein
VCHNVYLEDINSGGNDIYEKSSWEMEMLILSSYFFVVFYSLPEKIRYKHGVELYMARVFERKLIFFPDSFSVNWLGAISHFIPAPGYAYLHKIVHC